MTKVSEVTHFVYPYIIPRNPIFGWELMMSIRSIFKHFKGPFDITVIGEIPDWIDTTVIKCIQFDNNDYGLRVQSKTNQKILVAAELYPDMVLMHDDYYLIQNCTKEDFTEIRYLEEELNYSSDKTTEVKLTRFQRQIRWAYFKLQDLNKPYKRNFCTHAPFYYRSDRLQELSGIFDMVSTGEYSTVTENAYYNYFEVDAIPLGNFRAGYWGDKEFNASTIHKEAKILNHDERGFMANPWIIKFLHKKFNKKCPGEK